MYPKIGYIDMHRPRQWVLKVGGEEPEKKIGSIFIAADLSEPLPH